MYEVTHEGESTAARTSASIGARTSSTADLFTHQTIATIHAIIATPTFVFSFGNVWALALRLGVEPWAAPLIGPHYLSLYAGDPTRLRPARRLLTFSGLATLALGVAEPIAQGLYARAAFDAVPPLLLPGRAEAGPALLRDIQVRSDCLNDAAAGRPMAGADSAAGQIKTASTVRQSDPKCGRAAPNCRAELLERATRLEEEHGLPHGRPSCDNLGRELAIGTAEGRHLVRVLRSQPVRRLDPLRGHPDSAAGTFLPDERPIVRAASSAAGVS
ncbi:hypothetical protein GCM10023196_069260 [Actinoallomurus vinaceus]|uniref:Uncharacterized protein n=1 Tax=Actinoallomurus vinaceus TaxID=1080074 RepID=A0ABP8ULQ6_9ACTN